MGRDMDTDRHDELSSRNKIYRRLCDLQFVQPVPES